MGQNKKDLVSQNAGGARRIGQISYLGQIDLKIAFKLQKPIFWSGPWPPLKENIQLEL